MPDVPGAASGGRVRRVEPTAPAAAVLRRGDVLLSFDGVAIANDGTVPFRAGERIAFSFLVSQKYSGDTAVLRVLRDRRRVLSLTTTLAGAHRLVPVHSAGAPPSYFVFGGAVFTPASVPFLRSEYGRESDFEAPVKLLDALLHGHAEAAGEQVVLLSQVLPCDATLGIEDVVNTQVKAVNGTPIANLRALVDAIEGSKGPFVELSLQYDQVVVLDAAAARAATAAVMEAHCIPADRSADLRASAVGAGGGGRKQRGG